MLGSLSYSHGILNILKTKDAVYILKVSQHRWNLYILSNSSMEFGMKEIECGNVPDHTISNVVMIPVGNSIQALLLSATHVTIINSGRANETRTITNSTSLTAGVYQSGLGEVLLHNEKEIFSLDRDSKLKEKPWAFTYENSALKTWADFQMEYISKLHVLDDSENSSSTVLIEYRGSFQFKLVYSDSVI